MKRATFIYILTFALALLAIMGLMVWQSRASWLAQEPAPLASTPQLPAEKATIVARETAQAQQPTAVAQSLLALPTFSAQDLPAPQAGILWDETGPFRPDELLVTNGWQGQWGTAWTQVFVGVRPDSASNPWLAVLHYSANHSLSAPIEWVAVTDVPGGDGQVWIVSQTENQLLLAKTVLPLCEACHPEPFAALNLDTMQVEPLP